MSLVEMMKSAGFKAEASTLGEKPILRGVYKAQLAEARLGDENQYGQSYIAKFKVTEVLSGTQTRSAFPEFVGFFAVDEANAMSARKGIKKLLNGLCSVGVTIDQSSDEALYADIASKVGTEVYIKGYEKKPKMKDAEGNWMDNPDAPLKQDFGFMTEKNALAEAKKQNSKTA